MMAIPREHALHRLFAGATEQAFLTTLGIGDAPLIEYVTQLLARFIHRDEIYRLRDLAGRRLEEVAAMMLEAEAFPPEGKTCREIHRHIGDYTLFWTGLYPEALDRMRSRLGRDCFLDYCEQGKRSYHIASTFKDDPYQEEAAVLLRLSREFELCAYGLHQVRKELQLRQPDLADGTLRRLIH